MKLPVKMIDITLNKLNRTYSASNNLFCTNVEYRYYYRIQSIFFNHKYYVISDNCNRI